MDNPQIAEMQDRLLSKRAKTLLHHPQGMGNYFTFKTAIDILGLDWNDVAPGGVYNVTGAGYFDMGYMANHIGPLRLPSRRSMKRRRPKCSASIRPTACRS